MRKGEGGDQNAKQDTNRQKGKGEEGDQSVKRAYPGKGLTGEVGDVEYAAEAATWWR